MKTRITGYTFVSLNFIDIQNHKDTLSLTRHTFELIGKEMGKNI